MTTSGYQSLVMIYLVHLAQLDSGFFTALIKWRHLNVAVALFLILDGILVLHKGHKTLLRLSDELYYACGPV